MSVQKNTMILMTVALAVAAAVVMFSPSADAESSSTVDSVAVQIFDENTADYSALVYMNDKLPDALAASEWVQDPNNGLWYNINASGLYYGKVLTYGDVSGISAHEIRQDILAKFHSTFLTDKFTILQVKFNMLTDCQVAVTVNKSDLPVPYTDVKNVTLSDANVRFTSAQNAFIYTMASSTDHVTVDPSNVDIKPVEIRGTYNITVKGAGSLVASIPTTYNGSNYTISGIVKDRLGVGIEGATVKYSIDSGTSQTVSTRADGKFSIAVKPNSVLRIESVSYTGYTFATSSWISGTVISDMAIDADLFVAAEATVTVYVKDVSGRSIANAKVDASWYLQNGVVITKTTDGIRVLGATGRTDSEGRVKVAVGPTPSAGKVQAYVEASSWTSGYTFQIDEQSSLVDISNPLVYPGNAYINISTFADVNLIAVEKSIVVSAVGSKTGEGGSAVPYARMEAVWMYERKDTSHLEPEYKMSDDPTDFVDTPGAVTKLGTARVVSVKGDYGGHVIVNYTLPEIVNPTVKAYLYVYGVGAADPYAAFTFDYVDYHTGFPEGTSSLQTIVSGHPGCTAIPYTDVDNSTIKARQASYTVTVTISGEVPDSATIMYYMEKGEKITENKVGSTITFTYIVVEGKSSTIEILDVEGYSFVKNSIVMPTATHNMTFDSTASRIEVICARSTPAIVDTYTVNGLEAGDLITTAYNIAGLNLSTTYRAAASTLVINVMGWSGNLVTNMKITGASDVYIGPIIDKTAEASKLLERKFVTYSEALDIDPAVTDTVGEKSIQVYINGAFYTEFTTNDKGITIVTIPNVGGISYTFGNYSLTPRNITEGAFIGYTGFNLYDYIGIDRPTYITFTLRYTSSSSLDNTGPTVITDIVSDPVTCLFQVGTVQTLTAPELEGFSFAGWYLDGQKLSVRGMDKYATDLRIDLSMDGHTAVASYSPNEKSEPNPGIDSTTLVLGLVAIAVAILAFAYVILQNRRY